MFHLSSFPSYLIILANFSVKLNQSQAATVAGADNNILRVFSQYGVSIPACILAWYALMFSAAGEFYEANWHLKCARWFLHVQLKLVFFSVFLFFFMFGITFTFSKIPFHNQLSMITINWTRSSWIMSSWILICFNINDKVQFSSALYMTCHYAQRFMIYENVDKNILHKISYFFILMLILSM